MTRYISNSRRDEDLVLRVNKAGVPTDVLKINATTGLAAISQDPTALSNADATRMGLKAYAHGTTYNGGNAPTLNMNVATTSLVGEAIPYQMQDGTWRLRFNYTVHLSAGTAGQPSGLAGLNGVVWVTTNPQAIMIEQNTNSSSYPVLSRCEGTNTITCYFNTSGVDRYALSADVKLASKPTWAY